MAFLHHSADGAEHELRIRRDAERAALLHQIGGGGRLRAQIGEVPVCESAHLV